MLLGRKLETRYDAISVSDVLSRSERQGSVAADSRKKRGRSGRACWEIERE